MKKKQITLTILGGILVGFIAGLIAYPLFQSTAFAQQKKEKKEKKEKTVVQQLEKIEQAISDRNSPVVKELQKIEGAISDRKSPVVKQLDDITKKLDKLSEIQGELEKIERNMD